MEALSLAKEKGHEITVDDKPAYEYAKIFGIKGLRSIRLMLTLVKYKELTLDDLR